MAVPKDRFWAKVLFKEFIRHYRKLDDNAIINDVKQSMDDLDDLNENGESFGAKMVKWSTERMNSPQASANRINGQLGGRPKKVQVTSKIPDDKQEVIDFANERGIDVDDCLQCWYATIERGGKAKRGEPITNWWGYMLQWVETEKINRENKKG